VVQGAWSMIMSKRETVEEYLENLNPEALYMDGFDDCIAGIGAVSNDIAVVVYDVRCIIEHLMSDEGMDEVEAWEYFGFNIEGAYVGENTPILMHRVEHL
tara:strand:+ start:3584 stop:3883 length:300 start_codon:yes stop_codon:yes gene_type:complete